MNPVSVGLDLLLALLLLAALSVGVRLNARLKALRDGQDAFAKSVAELDAAALRAEAGLAALRSATGEAHDQLLARIETARGLLARLDGSVEAAELAVARAERAAPPPAPPLRAELPRRGPAGLPADARAEAGLPRASVAAPRETPAAAAGPLARFVARRTGTRS